MLDGMEDLLKKIKEEKEATATIWCDTAHLFKQILDLERKSRAESDMKGIVSAVVTVLAQIIGKLVKLDLERESDRGELEQFVRGVALGYELEGEYEYSADGDIVTSGELEHIARRVALGFELETEYEYATDWGDNSITTMITQIIQIFVKKGVADWGDINIAMMITQLIQILVKKGGTSEPGEGKKNKDASDPGERDQKDASDPTDDKEQSSRGATADGDMGGPSTTADGDKGGAVN